MSFNNRKREFKRLMDLKRQEDIPQSLWDEFAPGKPKPISKAQQIELDRAAKKARDLKEAQKKELGGKR